MHSSRMRTVRSLTVWQGSALRGCARGVWSWGVVSHHAREGGVPEGSGPGGVVPQHALRQTPPPVNRMTNSSKNITLATTSLRPVIKPL